MMKLRPAILALTFTVCCLTSCATAGGNLKLAPDAKIIPQESGTDGRDSFCSEFELSADQARSFLSKATIISRQELHNEFDWLSCYVRGALMDNAGNHQWEIRAGGTGSIKFASGEVVLLGCAECEDGFK